MVVVHAVVTRYSTAIVTVWEGTPLNGEHQGNRRAGGDFLENLHVHLIEPHKARRQPGEREALLMEQEGHSRRLIWKTPTSV